MKKLLMILFLGLFLICFVALALVSNNTQAKDKSIAHKKEHFRLDKDIGFVG